MTMARWHEITSIFCAALEKPEGERESFVRHACAQDAELEQQVIRLLLADEEAGSFLERAVISQPVLPPWNAEAVLPSGTLISRRFEIVRFIGQGGMGQVYEALDLELRGSVALKTIREGIASDVRALARFRREVLLTRRITHPNVCRTFDLERHSSSEQDGIKRDITFLTMELLDGETLAEFLHRRGRLSALEAFSIVQQMARALGAAHLAGIVHRDFKPSNVLLVPTPEGWRVVVTDFGLARAFLPEVRPFKDPASLLTGSQALLGTLAYMAPEQIEQDECTVASDIYSLGLVMYEIVTGVRPFADSLPLLKRSRE
jgi:serine/threonine protein kinase